MVLIKEQTDQWSEQSPETDRYKYSQAIFDKGERQFRGKKGNLPTRGAQTTRHSHSKKKQKESRHRT